MFGRAFIFCAIVFGITLVVGFLVAAIIRAIGIVVQRKGNTTEKNAEKSV